MRRLHFAIGLGGVIAFLVTGQLMRHHSPPMSTMTDAVRLMYRSRHLYILAAGLVNLMTGLYCRRHRDGWRRYVQAAGSALLLAAPALLLAAFLVEPNRTIHDPLAWSHDGLYALFGGSMLHLVCGAPR